jgi:hypothetical protein
LQPDSACRKELEFERDDGCIKGLMLQLDSGFSKGKELQCDSGCRKVLELQRDSRGQRWDRFGSSFYKKSVGSVRFGLRIFQFGSVRFEILKRVVRFGSKEFMSLTFILLH